MAEGEQVAEVFGFTEPEPRVWSGAFVVNELPLLKREDGPDRAALRFEPV